MGGNNHGYCFYWNYVFGVCNKMDGYFKRIFTFVITEKQLKNLKLNGWPDSILSDVKLFLAEHNYELFNLAFLGVGEYRIMFRKPDGKVDCKRVRFNNEELFPVKTENVESKIVTNGEIKKRKSK